jgi:hypothetical protein
VSRPNVTDAIVRGLGFARARVLDQRVASHARGDRSWDDRYREAIDAIDAIARAHEKSRRARPA